MSGVPWVSWQGPHMLLPASALPSWEGGNPPTHGRIVHAKTHCDPTGPVTDYDRACDVEGLVGVIPVGPHHAIVIGDEVPMSTLVRESSGSLAIVVPMTWEHEDAFDSLETLVRVTDEAAPRRTTGLRYPHPGGPVVLQAAVDGADDPLGGRIVADLDKGEYTIATFDGIVEEGEVRIHVLQRRTP